MKRVTKKTPVHSLVGVKIMVNGKPKKVWAHHRGLDALGLCHVYIPGVGDKTYNPRQVEVLPSAHLCVYIGTTNTVSGNPRRAWVFYDKDGNILAVMDEGYGNWGSARNPYPNSPKTGRIEVTIATYNDFCKHASFIPS